MLGFHCNECEIALHFAPNHTYSPSEFVAMWQQIGLSTGCFYYNGWIDYDVFRAIENGETTLLKVGFAETNCLVVRKNYDIHYVDVPQCTEDVDGPIDLSSNTLEAFEALMREV
jgi:hypothetical protein